jgi:hypothetical protein
MGVSVNQLLKSKQIDKDLRKSLEFIYAKATNVET